MGAVLPLSSLPVQIVSYKLFDALNQKATNPWLTGTLRVVIYGKRNRHSENCPVSISLGSNLGLVTVTPFEFINVVLMHRFHNNSNFTPFLMPNSPSSVHRNIHFRVYLYNIDASLP